MERYEVYGDSIRAGFRIEDRPYVEKLFGDQLVNYSFNGADVYDMLDISYNKSKNIPALALIGIGVNDLIKGRRAETVADRIFALVDRLIELGKTIIVESILPVEKYYFLSLHDFTEDEINSKIDSVNDLLKSNDDNKEYLFLDYGLSKKEFSTRDGVHPDIRGNMQLYDRLKDFLEKEKLL